MSILTLDIAPTDVQGVLAVGEVYTAQGARGVGAQDIPPEGGVAEQPCLEKCPPRQGGDQASGWGVQVPHGSPPDVRDKTLNVPRDTFDTSDGINVQMKQAVRGCCVAHLDGLGGHAQQRE